MKDDKEILKNDVKFSKGKKKWIVIISIIAIIVLLCITITVLFQLKVIKIVGT